MQATQCAAMERCLERSRAKAARETRVFASPERRRSRRKGEQKTWDNADHSFCCMEGDRVPVSCVSECAEGVQCVLQQSKDEGSVAGIRIQRPAALFPPYQQSSPSSSRCMSFSDSI